MRAAVAGFGMAATLASCAAPQPMRLAQFEATLAARDSATAALSQWCAARQIATPARIRAAPIHGGTAPAPSAELRALLAVQPQEPLGFRRVALRCGELVLSKATNWYVASRLTPAMNEALARTDAPFGTVAAPLHFTRQPLASTAGRAAYCPAGTVLSHRARLMLPDGAPLALVEECYTRAILR